MEANKNKVNVGENMKIAIVFDGLGVGGTERVGSDYAKLLHQLGHEITVINLRPNLTDMLKEFPKECEFVDFYFPRKLVPEQYVKLTKEGYLGNLAYVLAAPWFSLANVIYKIPCRIKRAMAREYDLAIAFSGHFNDLAFVTKGFVKAKKRMCWLHGALYGYLLISNGYLNLYKRMKNLVVLVKDAQEEVMMYNRNLKLNIHKVYNPTFIADKTIDESKVQQLQQKYGKFFVMVSRFDYPHKDHYTVVKALAILKEKYQEDYHLLLIGSGPEEEKVKKFAKSLGDEVHAHVHFMGNQSEVQNYYKAAHLLLHASVAGEGLPTIMLEALAYDLPMVVTDSKVGPREILGESEFGMLCRVQDPQDMAHKVHSICKDEELYHTYQKRGRERVKDFAPETIQKELEKVLNTLE